MVDSSDPDTMRNESVTTLKRRADGLLSDLERNNRPILITRQGLPGAYLVDVETYEFQQRRIAILEGILCGERDIVAGRTLTHQEVERRMEKWLEGKSSRLSS